MQTKSMKIVPSKSVSYSPWYGKQIDKENEINAEEIDGFTKSIKENGIIVPIIVSQLSDGRLQVLSGNRRLNAAKVLRMQEIPVVVWSGVTETDAALFIFTDNAHRRRLSPKQIALAIAHAYATLEFDDGTKLTTEQAAAIVKSLHNSQRSRPHINKNSGSKGAIFTKRPKDFDHVFHRIGYSAIAQTQFLSIITDLEPEVLDHAEKIGLDAHKIAAIVTNSQLRRETRDKPQARVTNYKKRLVEELARVPRKKAGEVVAQAARDLETKAYDLDSGIYSPELRDKAMHRPLKEGTEGAVLVHLNIQEHAQKLIGALTNGYELAPGENKYDFDRARIKKVITEYMTGMVKFFDKRQMAGVLDNLRMLEYVNALTIEILEDELEDREKKKDLISR